MNCVLLAAIIVSVVVKSSSSAYCFYGINAQGYGCTLYDANILNETDELIISGEHTPGFSDDDIAYFSMTANFIPLGFFERFKGLRLFTVYHLREINVHSLKGASMLDALFIQWVRYGMSTVAENIFEDLPI